MGAAVAGEIYPAFGGETSEHCEIEIHNRLTGSRESLVCFPCLDIDYGVETSRLDAEFFRYFAEILFGERGYSVGRGRSVFLAQLGEDSVFGIDFCRVRGKGKMFRPMLSAACGAHGDGGCEERKP